MAHYEDVMQRILSRGGPASQMAAETGIDMAADPLAYAGSVVPPPNYQSSYNPAGAYAEAGRTVPNRASEQAMAMNQLTQPQGGVPSDLHRWNDPYGRSDDNPFWEQQMPYFGGEGYPGAWQENMGFPHGITAQGAVDPSTGQMRVVPPDTSVVAPPRMPTEKETLDRGVLEPANERDRAFSTIHDAYYTGADFGYEQGWPERLGVPQEYIEVYMAVPDAAKQYAYDNPTDAVLQQFEEKYGFPLDVSIEISM